MGLNSNRNVILGIAFAVLLLASLAHPSIMGVAYAANSLTVNAYTTGGTALSMYATIQSGGSTVKSGYTPLSITGTTGATYTVTVYNYGTYVFDHWGNDSTSNPRTLTLSGDTTATAYYKTGSTSTSSSKLTVNAVSTSDGSSKNMWTTILSGSSTVRAGFTPLTYTGNTGSTYSVTVSDYGSTVFDHWENGSTSRTRTVTLNSDATIKAYYRTGTTSTTTSTTQPSSMQTLIPKTGVFVALYMYPGSTGSVHWQKVIDEKTKHPSVPIVAAFNPSSGPGWSKDSTIANWVAKLRQAGVIAIGYTTDDYGTRSLSSLRADADKYKNWYNADGLFIDEFTNKVGYEAHYSSLTSYAKSIGMKMTMGNPGTDVPKSYIGSVDVINITEGRGYMPISWLQYCVNCSASSGWHYQYDKRNFAYIRYDISWLDTAFVVESSKWVGLAYVHTGNDSNGRWFTVPSYFGTLVATLDR